RPRSRPGIGEAFAPRASSPLGGVRLYRTNLAGRNYCANRTRVPAARSRNGGHGRGPDGPTADQRLTLVTPHALSTRGVEGEMSEELAAAAISPGQSVPSSDPLASVRARLDELANDLRAAIAHHQAGRLDEAEAFYWKLLEKAPDHPQAL